MTGCQAAVQSGADHEGNVLVRPLYYSCMAKLSGKEIQKLARSIVIENPGGIRYSVLVEKISQQNPETPKNTIHGAIWNLDTIFPNEITKPSRGLFTPVAKSGNESVAVGSTEQIAPTGAKIKESDFYTPFAEWLKDDLDEVTEVVSLGGAGLKSKWGTPDVVGIYKPLASNLIKFPISIRVRAQRFSPDMFYVNEFADRLKRHDADIFEELFG